MRISNWQSKLVEHWTGYIRHDGNGYAAVLYEGFGTYETLEEAEAYLKENDYERIAERMGIVQLKEEIDKLTDDERVELFKHYCMHCGEINPSCQCWNDD